MKDITASLFADTDARKTPSVGQITRLSLIQNRLRKLKAHLDPSRPILSLVITPDRKLVQKELGGIQLAEELIGYYNETHVISLTVHPGRNAVVICLTKRLNEKRD